jgi:chromate transporter
MSDTPAPLETHDDKGPGVRSARTALAEVAGIFLRLGCVSFGGPTAHLGHLRAELVERRRWLDDAQYADLVALCQVLPGPSSSQVVFALGMRRAGLPGALVASACFTLPSAALMIAFAYGVGRAFDPRSGWLHGLKLSAVAVVAQAVWRMAKTHCPDRARRALCLASAGALIALPGTVTQLVVLTVGALLGPRVAPEVAPAVTPTPETRPAGPPPASALAALGMFLALLVALPTLAAVTGSRALVVLSGFYRAGSLVFGGGHVVLPLLREAVVRPGGLADDRFLAGYGAAQAIPGPLFTFAAYLGTAMREGAARWLGGVLCLLAIFLPGWLLVYAALPRWDRLKTRPAVQSALVGIHAAVVGVLLAALCSPVFIEGVRSPRDLLVALVALALLELRKTPPWQVVLACAAAGSWALAR